MKIVLTDWQTVNEGALDLAPLEELGEVVVWPLTSDDQIAERIADADAVICNKTRLHAGNLCGAKNLRYIGLFATGYNNIDIAYAREHGITVCNAGSYSTAAVAQHAIACMLHHASHVADYAAFTAGGGWCDAPTFSPFVFPMQELCGKTLGIVGYGSIGRAVADIALAFGMKVVAYTRTPKDDARITFVDFATLCASSDYISVHCPLTPETERLFDAAAFAACKPTAYFVNTARGGVVDEPALRNALEQGQIAGAAIDVLTLEPQRADCVLAGAPNLIMTPHVAWAPLETRQRLLGIVADNLRAYLDGTPKNVVS